MRTFFLSSNQNYMLKFKVNDMNYQMAKDLYDLWEMSEYIYVQYLAEELARNRTRVFRNN